MTVAERPRVRITPQNKCSFCAPICCGYLTQAVDTPRSKSDFDHLLWQIAHENISVYEDNDGWYLLIKNKCSHLLPDGRCGIYESRPQVCRDYSNDWCEFDEPAEKHFELYFEGYPDLLAYCHKRFKNWPA